MKLTELMGSQYKIYCDMDGVLTNFDKRFEEFSGGISTEEYEQKYGTAKFWEVVDKVGEKFWTEMEWMPGGKVLWNYIKHKNVYILSSPSRAVSSKSGKHKWVNTHLQPKPELMLVQSANKKNHANEHSILIDDRLDNLQQWKSAGGIAIRCVDGNVGKVIKKLQSLGI